MKKLKIVLIVVLALILTGLGIGAIVVRNMKRGGMIDYNKDMEMLGLSENVTVYRDKFGIPHIFAQNDRDLYRATGYVVAADRLWQMDLLRRVTEGRLSEIFGKDMIENDVVLRALRIPEKSKTILEKSRPEIIEALEAYAEGVNLYIETHSDDLPFEFRILGYQPEKWQPVHSVNMIGYMAWDLKLGWSEEFVISKALSKLDSALVSDLLPDYALEKTAIFPNFKLGERANANQFLQQIEEIEKIAPPVFNGSNNWVVSGKKSATGKPILCNDMHLGLMIPGVWTQIHQHSESGLDVTGVMVPGQPFVIAGRNARIAWGMTNVMLDAVDFYEETIPGNDSDAYIFNGKPVKMDVRNEEIKIKGEEKPIVRKIRFTHRGPVVSGMKNISDKVISMHWTGNDPSNEIEGVYKLNRAGNIQEFRDACKGFMSVSQNIVYADIEGNIGLQTSAGIPVRKEPGWRIFPGTTDEFDWKGYVPFDSLPNVFNPESGFLYSANNKTTGNDYPHYISQWFYLPYRADRIFEMLQSKEKLTIDDMKAIQNDQHSKLVQQIVPQLISAFSTNEEKPDEIVQECLSLMQNWDFDMRKDKSESHIFEEFYKTLAKNLAEDEMGKDFYKEFSSSSRQVNYLISNISKKGQSPWCDDIRTTDRKESFDDIIRLSFNESCKKLEQQSGSDPQTWLWGNVHTLPLKHPLGKVNILNKIFNLNRVFPAGGSYHTVSPYSYDFSESYEASNGASHRHIYDFSVLDKSQTLIPTGVSGIPASAHYCDQSSDYMNGIYHNDYTSREMVEKNAVYTMKFLKK